MSVSKKFFINYFIKAIILTYSWTFSHFTRNDSTVSTGQ